MAILVAGGAGYIGSHTCVELLNAGYEVVVVDNLYNSSEEALKRVEQITGKTVKFYEADVLDREALEKIFDAEDIVGATTGRLFGWTVIQKNIIRRGDHWSLF